MKNLANKIEKEAAIFHSSSQIDVWKSIRERKAHQVSEHPRHDEPQARRWEFRRQASREVPRDGLLRNMTAPCQCFHRAPTANMLQLLNANDLRSLLPNLQFHCSGADTTGKTIGPCQCHAQILSFARSRHLQMMPRNSRTVPRQPCNARARSAIHPVARQRGYVHRFLSSSHQHYLISEAICP